MQVETSGETASGRRASVKPALVPVSLLIDIFSVTLRLQAACFHQSAQLRHPKLRLWFRSWRHTFPSPPRLDSTAIPVSFHHHAPAI